MKPFFIREGFGETFDTGECFLMKIAYARVSTVDQNLDLQIDALKKAGCEKVFTDQASGVRSDRAGLNEALEFCRADDSLVVWKLDRLGRSLKDLISTVNSLHQRKVGFVSLQENIDTTTSGGKLVFYIFGALAEFERDLIRDRTNAGLQAARARTAGRTTAEAESETNGDGEEIDERRNEFD